MSEQVAKIVNQADQFFNRERFPREAGQRKSLCDIAANLVTRSARRSGFEAHSYQLRGVHRELGAVMPYEGTIPRHVFSIINSGKIYVADISFCQFMNPKTGIIEFPHDWGSFETGVLFRKHPLTRILLSSGYFELTDTTLRDYLGVSIAPMVDKNYVQNATVEKLFSINKELLEIPMGHTDAELDRMLDGI